MSCHVISCHAKCYRKSHLMVLTDIEVAAAVAKDVDAGPDVLAWRGEGGGYGVVWGVSELAYSR